MNEVLSRSKDNSHHLPCYLRPSTEMGESRLSGALLPDDPASPLTSSRPLPPSSLSALINYCFECFFVCLPKYFASWVDAAAAPLG